MLLYIALVGGAVVCAAQAIRSPKLLTSVLWLAGVSVLLSIVFYQLGAPQIAVIELSVGAGLITVLFVFAISVAGDEALDPPSIVPRPIAGLLVVFAIALIGLQMLPLTPTSRPGVDVPFAQMLWEERALDMLVQVVLIFAGVVGVLGLIGETRIPPSIKYEEEPEEEMADVVSGEYRAAGRAEPDGRRPVRTPDRAQPD